MIRCLSLLIIVIIAATSLASAVFVTPSNAAKPLPPEVQSEINEDIKDCDGKVKFVKGFLTRRDVNGDGIEDFVLDYGRFICGQNATQYCGSAGCVTVIFASLPEGKFVKVLNDNVRGIEFKTLHGRPAMLLHLHGSSCGKAGAAPCNETLYWNGEKFSPAK
jgi:hypothetical protein